MAGDPKFTEEQKYEIAVEFVSGMLSHSEICRKWDISPTYAYKLKDRALDLLRQGMGRPTGKPDAQEERLQKRVPDLEQLAGDPGPAIRCRRPHQAWQIGMTSFQRSDLRPVYLVSIIDCYTRPLVGWPANDRCKASDRSSAFCPVLESRGLRTKESCSDLVLRSENGAEPSSKHFVEFLEHGIKGQYTGYNAPDDNAYVERVIRTIKEEEIWSSDIRTPNEVNEAHQSTLMAA